MITNMLAACLMLASQTYTVPPAALIGILQVEGGAVGQEVANTNGTSDLGPMQINTTWVPKLAQLWSVDSKTARRWVRDDGCVNIIVGAWILRQGINDSGHLWGGIARYHSARPLLGARYTQKVVQVLKRYGLIEPAPVPTPGRAGTVHPQVQARAETNDSAN